MSIKLTAYTNIAVPSVTRKAFALVKTMIIPFINPTNPPTAMPTKIDVNKSAPVICAKTVVMPAKPIVYATDISKLPVMSSIVCPKATIPKTDTVQKIFSKFLKVRKTGENIAPTMIRIIRKITAGLSLPKFNK